MYLLAQLQRPVDPWDLSGLGTLGYRRLVVVPCPPDRFGRHGRVDSPAAELELGLVELVVAGDQPKSKASGPAALRLDVASIELLLGVESVPGLQEVGESFDLPAIEWSQASTYLELALAGGPGRSESAGTQDRSGEWTVVPASMTEPQSPSHVAQIELEATG